jgi:hypothetical protein
MQRPRQAMEHGQVGRVQLEPALVGIKAVAVAGHLRLEGLIR